MKRRNFVTAAIASVGSLFLSKAEGRTPIVTAIRPKSPTRDDECKILRAWIIGDQPECIRYEKRDLAKLLRNEDGHPYWLEQWEFNIKPQPVSGSVTVFADGARITKTERNPVRAYDEESAARALSITLPAGQNSVAWGFVVEGDRLFLARHIMAMPQLWCTPVKEHPMVLVDYMVDCE